jgi:hypothetical protein
MMREAGEHQGQCPLRKVSERIWRSGAAIGDGTWIFVITMSCPTTKLRTA